MGRRGQSNGVIPGRRVMDTRGSGDHFQVLGVKDPGGPS